MKQTIPAIIATLILVIGVVVLLRTTGGASSSNVSSQTLVDGKQVITMEAKGGYYPKDIQAKANMPLVLKMKTDSTFDCSSALRIPAINYSKHLPSSGETEIEIPAQKSGTSIQGLCSMGMYNFTINFN